MFYQGRTRQQRARSHYSSSSEGDGAGSVLRSLLGVSPYCLKDDVQLACSFTPTCWLSGGIPQGGCDSLLYSCCVPPDLVSPALTTLQDILQYYTTTVEYGYLHHICWDPSDAYYIRIPLYYYYYY